MANLDLINPLLCIKPRDSFPEEVKEVAKWFKTRTAEPCLPERP